jgi:hypothetical protein
MLALEQAAMLLQDRNQPIDDGTAGNAPVSAC